MCIRDSSHTDPKYAGLFRDVSNFRPTSSPTKRLPELVAVADVPSFAEQMARLDRIADSLNVISERGWKAQHGDAYGHAVLLEEAFHELSRTSDDASVGASALKSELQSDLKKAERLARSLTAALKLADRVAIEKSYLAISEQCVSCHQQHRD